MMKRLISFFALIVVMAFAASASYYPPVEIKLGNSGFCINISSSTSEGVTTYTIETTDTDPFITSANIGQKLSSDYNTITFEYNCTQGIDDPEIFFSPIIAGRELFYGPLAPTGPSEWKTATVYIANARTALNWGNSPSDYLRFDWGYKSGVTIQVRKLQFEADLCFEEDGLAFTKNPDGISVTVYGTGNREAVVIPESVENFGNTYSVTKIGEEAFKDCKELTSVTIPNSVTSIGSSAFYGCSGLTSVIWNAKECHYSTSINYVSDLLFYDLPIKTFTFGDEVEAIPEGLCYSLSGLTSVTIPNSVTSIGNYAFDGCNNIENLSWNAKNCASMGDMPKGGIISATIGNEVEILPDNFLNGSKITEITIPNSVTTIGNSAFNGCSCLAKVEISDLAAWCGISFGNETANPLFYAHHLYMNGSEIKDLVIPNSVTSINNSAFRDCSGLTSVTIPNSVTSIGSSAFSGCNGLTNLIWNAKNCSSNGNMSTGGITSATIGNEVELLPDYFLYGSKITEITIPNSVTSIGNYAFTGCVGLTSVSIGNSVTEIGDYAFDQLGSLKSLTIGNSVTLIGYCAFRDCSGLTGTLTIPNSVKIIKTAAFQNCSGLTGALIIPNSVMEIDRVAFQGCNGFTSLTIPASVAKVENEAFSECDGLMSVNWNAKNCEITLGDWGNKLAPFDLPRIKTFTFGNEVERIPQYLCYGLSGLSSIEIPNSVTSIGENAFNNCSGLTSLTIPNSVTSIGENAFNNCSGLTSVTIGNSVTSIGYDPFKGCSGLKTVNWNAKNCADFSESYTPFYRYLSYSSESCYSLTGIETFIISNEVERIPAYLCYGLSGITTLSLGNSVTEIGSSAFEGCRGLTGLEFPNSLNSIGQKAFYNCRGLLSLTFPNSVTNIGEQAFANCTDLDNIYSYPNPSNVTLGDDVFYEVPKYTCVLHVTPEHFDAYKKASQWKTFFNIIDDLAGVEGVEVDAATKEVEGFYDLKGIRLNEPARGQAVIVRYKDGTAKKVVVK